jgi:hypothetical protein
MAFSAANFAVVTNPVSIDSASIGIYIYAETGATVATIKAAGYLNDIGQIDDTSAATQESTKNRTQQLHAGGVVILVGSDGMGIFSCTLDGSSGNVTFDNSTDVTAAA